MTKEDKELLIKDLCGRLPYGVIVQVNDGLRGTYDRRLVQVFCDRVSCSVNVCNPFKECICIDSVKPYLRPLSSMTEEEHEEYREYVKEVNGFTYNINCSDLVDWFNRKMFDYRGLIQKGLAIEVPEGMYNNSNEKDMDYKKAYEAIFDRAKEMWGIYKGERHIIEFIFPEVCYLKDKENRLKDMVNSEQNSINGNIPYKKSEVICVNCSYRWLAERQVTKPLKDIECPWCGKQGFVIETGEIIKNK